LFSGALRVVNIFIKAKSSMHGRKMWKVKIILVFGSTDFISR